MSILSDSIPARSSRLGKKFLPRALALAAIPAFTLAPIKADCLPSAPNGWMIPFTMSTHQTNGVVSYTTGTLYSNFYFGIYSLSGDNFAQLFSDRFVPCGQYCFPTQPFNENAADRVGVQISENFFIQPVTPNVTLTLDTWGHAKLSFQGHCDSSTNLLYGSVSNNTMVVISFGTPQAPPR